MPVIETGVGTRICTKEETSWGVLPTASGSKLLRRVGWSSGLRIASTQSAEVRSDRAISDFRLTSRSVSGDYTGELSVSGQQDFLKWLAGSAWVAGTAGSALTTVTAATGPDTLTRSAGSWITDGYRVGDIIRMTGWTTTATANNNKNFRIIGLTATVMTLSLASPSDTVVLVAKAAGDSVIVSVPGNKILMPGTTRFSFAAEKKYMDFTTPQYQTQTGLRVGSCALRFPPDGLVGFTFGVMGKDEQSLSTTEYFTSPTTEDTSDILAFANGKIRMGGVDIATVTGLDFTIDNNLTTVAVGGSRFSPDVFWGRQPITGTITALFESEVLPNAFTNETELALNIFLEAPTGTPDNDFVSITFPRMKLGSADIPITTEQGLPLTMAFTALKARAADTALGFDSAMCVWQRSL